MYLDYFGLKEKPFSLSPDPKYLYYSRSHKEALAQMIYTASQDTGFMVLTGEVGTGKTILINALINQFPKTYHFAKIYHSALSPEGLIQNICKEFKLDFVNRTMTQLVLKLQDYLKWNYNSGRKSVLILDEAQNLGTATLEEIRLLSNFEAAHKKIMQIYLIGQPELEEKLWNENLRQLRERVSLKFELQRLDREETKLYINHRLKVAGLSEKRKLFMEDSINQVYTISQGIPRRINILCDNALLLVYSNLYRHIDADTIKSVGYYSPMQEMAAKKLPDNVIQKSANNSIAVKTHQMKAASSKEVAQQQRINTTEIGNSNGNGAIDYKKIENIMHQFIEHNKILFMGKPKIGKIIFTILFAFMMLVLAFYVAIQLSIEFGILK